MLRGRERHAPGHLPPECCQLLGLFAQHLELLAGVRRPQLNNIGRRLRGRADACSRAEVGWPSPSEPLSPSLISRFLRCGDGTKCPLARYGATDPYYRDRTCHICRRRGRSNLSQRSSHHEVHLRTTELRLARTFRRNAERPDDEYLREIFEIRR